MSNRISQYPEKCGLCGAPRKLVEGHEVFHHELSCDWRADSDWLTNPKPVQTGLLALDVRWSNGSSTVNAAITQEQYGRILGIIHEKEPT